MSDATKAAMDAAIQAHLADDSDGKPEQVVTGYVLQTSSIDLLDTEHKTYYRYFIADDQPYATTLGLAHVAQLSLESHWNDDRRDD